MSRWGELNPVRFDDGELNVDLGSGNYIFVGSSCDMFATDIPSDWINKTLKHCQKFDNTYLFQSKNPGRFKNFLFPEKTILGTTIETNRIYTSMNCIPRGTVPTPFDRAMQMAHLNFRKMVTIEPIMDFSLQELLYLITIINPEWVNIGSDSGGNKLPEPSRDKIQQLIKGLSDITVVRKKTNIKRLLT
jgi:protein gp37